MINERIHWSVATRLGSNAPVDGDGATLYKPLNIVGALAQQQIVPQAEEDALLT